MSLTSLTGWIGAQHASAQQMFRTGDWSDWGGFCESPIEQIGSPRSRGQALGRLLGAGYTFGAMFADAEGISIDQGLPGESIRALGVCYADDINVGDSIEVQTDFGDAPSMVCPDDHPFLGLVRTTEIGSGELVARPQVRCQILGVLEL